MNTSDRMWFGTREKAMWLPAPNSGMTRSQNYRMDSFSPNNGGRNIDRTFASHASYDLDFTTRNAADRDVYDYGTRGLWVFSDFAAGQYGSGFIYFCDLMIARENLLAQQWASPMLIKKGYKAFTGVEPTLEVPSSEITNLAAYGSFETAQSGTTEVRRNNAIDPRMTSAGYTQGNAAITRIPGGGVSVTRGASDGYMDISLTSSLGTTANITGPKVLSFVSDEGLDYVQVFKQGFAGVSAPRTVIGNRSYLVISDVLTALTLRVRPKANSTVFFDLVMMEQTDQLRPYFDAGMTNEKGFTTEWAGTANASASIMRSATVTVRENKFLDANATATTYFNTAASQATITTVPEGVRYTLTSVGAVALGLGLPPEAFAIGDSVRMMIRARASKVLSARARLGTTEYVVPDLTTEWQWIELIAPAQRAPSVSSQDWGLVIRSTYTSWSAGDWVEYSNVFFAVGTDVGLPFSATSPNFSDFIHGWSGAANASTSVQQGVRAAGITANECVAILSWEWRDSGSTSLRIIPTSSSSNSYAEMALPSNLTACDFVARARLTSAQQGALASTARTIRNIGNGGDSGSQSQFANAPGEYLVRLSRATTGTRVLLFNGASRGNGDVWWDDLTIVEGNHPDLMPFDGDTYRNGVGGVETGRWNGTKYASTSTLIQEWRRWREFPNYAAVFNFSRDTYDDETYEGMDFTILIPPGYKLWLLALGNSSNANFGVDVTGYQHGPEQKPLNNYSSQYTSLTTRQLEFTNPSNVGYGLLPFTDMTNFLMSGYTYRADYVTIHVGRRQGVSPDATGRVSLHGMMALVLPEGEVPDRYDFSPGRGSTGLRFSDDAIPVEYVLTDRTLVSISGTLEEVEQWSPRE